MRLEVSCVHASILLLFVEVICEAQKDLFLRLILLILLTKKYV